MTSHSDLTFITNEKGRNLLERFKVLIKDTDFFDVLVGYFYTSGFHALYRSLLLESHIAEGAAHTLGPREVILSLYQVG